MSIRLYDLAGADPALRFSPYCWRTRMALAHKGLEAEFLPWRFHEQDRLAPHGTRTVPTLVDGDRALADSWAIATYLEDAYPDRPSLFGGETGRAHARLINAWADTALNPAIVRLVVFDIWAALDPRDQPYFRQTREARFGRKLEEVAGDREPGIQAARTVLTPVRLVLAGQSWLGGAAPSYADHIVFGSLQWARCMGLHGLLAEDDPVREWLGRMLGLYDGLGAGAALVAA